MEYQELSLTRRLFVKMCGVFGTSAALGGASLLSGCSTDGGEKEALYHFTVISGAVLTDSDQSTGKYKYKQKCSSCGWESVLSTEENGTGVTDEFTCPRCGYHQEVRIVVSKGGGEGVESSTETLSNLMSAIKGETQAYTKYMAFADVATSEGHIEIGNIFRAISSAELQHGDDEFSILQSFGPAKRPDPDKVTPGTTKENLQTAVDGETYEYKEMYPEFYETAKKDSIYDAVRVFNFAMQAEEVHANIYADLLRNIDQIDSTKYAKLYRCPVCGNIELTTRPDSCPICSVPGSIFIEYDPFMS